LGAEGKEEKPQTHDIANAQEKPGCCVGGEKRNLGDRGRERECLLGRKKEGESGGRSGDSIAKKFWEKLGATMYPSGENSKGNHSKKKKGSGGKEEEKRKKGRGEETEKKKGEKGGKKGQRMQRQTLGKREENN